MRQVVVVVLVALATTTARADDFEGSLIPTVMDRRWAWTFGFGAELMRASGERSANHPLPAVDVALHYRIVPELELGLALDGAFVRNYGRAALFIDGRYRVSAETPWSPLVQLQLGFGVATSMYGGDHANDRRFAARVGFGAERRFRSWSFLLIAHAVIIGANGDANNPYQDGYDDYNIARENVFSVSLSWNAIYHWGAQPRPARFGGPERQRR